MARDEGWLAEHMLILKLTSPEGVVKFITAAFPSACGKTNLAMLRPTIPGLEGRDPRRRHRLDAGGRGRPAVGGQPRVRLLRGRARHQPERPTPTRWTPSRRATRCSPTSPSPRTATSGGRAWRTPRRARPAGRASPGRPRATSSPATPTAATARRSSSATSSRRSTTTRAGVPIDAILFGGRRKTTVPLVFEARDWTHGTFLGATLSSETTAAATGAVGVVRRDPMAMLPFIGYNAGHYFNHWITVGKDNDAAKLPKIFYVNWFRRDERGRLPVARLRGELPGPEVGRGAHRGHRGRRGDPDRPRPHRRRARPRGPRHDPRGRRGRTRRGPRGVAAELPQIQEWFEKFGDDLPAVLWTELDGLKAAPRRLSRPPARRGPHPING